MREVISLHLGQCGNQIASRFWEKIANEHDVNTSGFFSGLNPENALRYVEVFFKSQSDNRYVPRAVLIDTEPSAVNSIIRDKFKDFYTQQNIILQNTGAGNSWCCGYEIGAASNGIGSQILDVVRREVEACDCLQGFQMTHSLAGGTGSGLGSWLCEALRDEFPGIIFTTYSVGASEISSVVVEPYNSILSLNTLHCDVDGVHLLDNDALATLCKNQVNVENPNFNNFNELVSDVILGMTCSLRYPGQHNTSLRKQMTNLMPDTKYHLFMVSQSPLRKSGFIGTAVDLATDIFKQKNMMVTTSQRKSEKVLAASAIFRGNIPTREIEEAVSQIQAKEPRRFADYLTNSIVSSVCNTPPKDCQMSATSVVNSSLIADTLRRTLDAAHTLFSKKAYLHYYNNTIADPLCIEQCLENIESVYHDYIGLESLTATDGPLRRPRAMNFQNKNDHNYNLHYDPQSLGQSLEGNMKFMSKVFDQEDSRNIATQQKVDEKSTTTTNSSVNSSEGFNGY